MTMSQGTFCGYDTKSKNHKIIDKLDFITLKYVCASKKPHQKVKKATHRIIKIFVIIYLLWDILYFSDYETHWTIRRPQVLEEENRGKKPTPPLPPPTSESGKLHLDYKTHPHFPPKFGGSASYSPKNMVNHDHCFDPKEVSYK